MHEKSKPVFLKSKNSVLNCHVLKFLPGMQCVELCVMGIDLHFMFLQIFAKIYSCIIKITLFCIPLHYPTCKVLLPPSSVTPPSPISKYGFVLCFVMLLHSTSSVSRL